jgi:LPXTG-site transpeptidase (sortase) family protein
MHARNLLTRAIGSDEGNAVAWLWLSQVLHSLSGREFCLERALALNLTNDKAHRKLVQARKQLAGELLHKSIASIRAGQYKRAYHLLRRATGELKSNALDLLQSSKAAASAKLSTTPLGRHEVKRALAASWVPVMLIVTGTVVICLSLLVTGSVMARTIPLPNVNLEAQPDRAVQAAVQPATPPPTPLPTPVPPTIEPTAPLPPPEPPTPAPTAQPTLMLYPPNRIIIPSIAVDATVVPVGLEIKDVDGTPQPIWTVPDPSLAGWHETSALLGMPGNTVINGHNWPRDAAFQNLHTVQPGEQIVLFSDLISFTYEITEVVVLPEGGQPLEVQQANTRYIQPTDDERVTLVTCHPYGSTRERLIVIARPIEDS